MEDLLVFTFPPCLILSISKFYQPLKMQHLLTLSLNAKIKFYLRWSLTFFKTHSLTQATMFSDSSLTLIMLQFIKYSSYPALSTQVNFKHFNSVMTSTFWESFYRHSECSFLKIAHEYIKRDIINKTESQGCRIKNAQRRLYISSSIIILLCNWGCWSPEMRRDRHKT